MVLALLCLFKEEEKKSPMLPRMRRASCLFLGTSTVWLHSATQENQWFFLSVRNLQGRELPAMLQLSVAQRFTADNSGYSVKNGKFKDRLMFLLFLNRNSKFPFISDPTMSCTNGAALVQNMIQTNWFDIFHIYFVDGSFVRFYNNIQ